MRIKRFPKYTRLEISWDDILSDPSWNDSEGLSNARTLKVKTMGYFHSNQKNTIRVAHSVAEDGNSDVMCIPWGTIREIREL